jgi:hypothetical protein
VPPTPTTIPPFIEIEEKKEAAQNILACQHFENGRCKMVKCKGLHLFNNLCFNYNNPREYKIKLKEGDSIICSTLIENQSKLVLVTNSDLNILQLDSTFEKLEAVFSFQTFKNFKGKVNYVKGFDSLPGILFRSNKTK